MQLSDKITVRPSHLGTAIVCVDTIAPQERLFRLTGSHVEHPARHTLQRADREHLAPEGAAWAMINHACEPNCAIDYTNWELVAVRSIAVGDEITFNYHTTEWELATPFACACGATRCAETIRGFRHLSPAQRAAVRPFLSPFLESRFHEIPPAN